MPGICRRVEGVGDDAAETPISPSIQMRSEPWSSPNIPCNWSRSLCWWNFVTLTSTWQGCQPCIQGPWKATITWQKQFWTFHKYQTSMCREVRTWIVCTTCKASEWLYFGHERKALIQKSRFRSVTGQFFSSCNLLISGWSSA